MQAPAPRMPNETTTWLTKKVLPVVGITAFAWTALIVLLMTVL